MSDTCAPCAARGSFPSGFGSLCARWTLARYIDGRALHAHVHVALFVVWAIYLVSPYVAFYRLAKAVEAKDLAAIKERVNFRAVRISLSRQIVSAYAKATGTDTAAGSPVGQIAVSAGTAVVDPLIAPYVTPEAIIDLLTKGQTGIASSAGPASPPPSLGSSLQASELSLERLRDLFFASESRGFRAYVFALPFQQPPEERFRLLFRLSGPSSGFTWRLAGVELPARVRDQLVQQLVRREATAVPR